MIFAGTPRVSGAFVATLLLPYPATAHGILTGLIINIRQKNNSYIKPLVPLRNNYKDFQQQLFFKKAMTSQLWLITDHGMAPVAQRPCSPQTAMLYFMPNRARWHSRTSVPHS